MKPVIESRHVGKGIVASFAMDAATAARDIPGVVRDVLDAVLAATGGRRAVDVIGTTENVDLASCFVPGGVRTAVVNHAAEAIEVEIFPLSQAAEPGQKRGPGTPQSGTWTDLVTGTTQPGRSADGSLAVKIPARGYVCWEYKIRPGGP